MSECLKLLYDLSQMAEPLNINILRHFFEQYDPSTSRPLRETILHFHMRELESSDYRSAYHQFCDWLYGWNVSDAAEYADVRGSVAEYLRSRRTPRDIDIKHDRERAESMRLMKTFETLCSLSRRHLKKFYIDIEAEMPRLGQGLETLATNTHKQSVKNRDEELDDGSSIGGGPGGSRRDSQSDAPDDDVERVWATSGTSGTDAGGVSQAKMSSPDNETGVDAAGGSSASGLNKKQRLRHGSLVEAMPEGDEEGSQTSLASDHENRESMEPRASTLGNGQQGFNFLNSSVTAGSAQSGTIIEGPGGFSQAAENMDDSKRALQRDVNHIFAEVDRCTEYSLVCMSSVLVVLAFAEILDEKEVYNKFCNLAHELSMDFVSNTLKTTWDLLNKEIPTEVTLASLRDPYALRDVLKRLLELRTVNGRVPKYRMRKLFYKFAMLHDIFRATDIHIFPNFVAAHKEGAKCAKFSAFDSCLWLTGGYDCVIRISDIRSANNHICLAQYVGHKSIVTDVHFTKNDSQIVSSSFDRTLKIWNAQQATAERTLVGHTDAVTSCDITSDGRYIASGSTDCTVRFWDYNNGECITIIRKHTRWVKCVRFSPDGRHLATAGLDRRIYIWDTKILANSRSPTHSRCIDPFGDYVLDMALCKPSLLLATARDSTVRLFDYMTGHELQSFNLSPSWACSVCFSDNGEYFATGSFDNNVLIFRTKDFVKMREIRVFNLGIMCVRFPKDLSYVIVGTTEGFIQQIPL
eukprot:jgi/Hompol1/5036/HPOL_004113-RA